MSDIQTWKYGAVNWLGLTGTELFAIYRGLAQLERTDVVTRLLSALGAIGVSGDLAREKLSAAGLGVFDVAVQALGRGMILRVPVDGVPELVGSPDRVLNDSSYAAFCSEWHGLPVPAEAVEAMISAALLRRMGENNLFPFKGWREVGLPGDGVSAYYTLRQ